MNSTNFSLQNISKKGCSASKPLRIFNRNLISFFNRKLLNVFSETRIQSQILHACFPFRMRVYPIFFCGIQWQNQTCLKGSFARPNLNCKQPLTTKICKEFLFFIFLCVYDLKLHSKFWMDLVLFTESRHALHSLTLRLWEIHPLNSWNSSSERIVTSVGNHCPKACVDATVNIHNPLTALLCFGTT